MLPDINVARGALRELGYDYLCDELNEDNKYGITINSLLPIGTNGEEELFALVKAVQLAHQAVGHVTSKSKVVLGHAHFGCIDCEFFICGTCKEDLFE